MTYTHICKLTIIFVVTVSLLHILISFILVNYSFVVPLTVNILQNVKQEFAESIQNCHNTTFNITNIPVNSKSIISTINFSNISYTNSAAGICSKTPSLKLLTVIISSPQHYNRRNFLRKTWTRALISTDKSVVFFVGQSNQTRVNLVVAKEAKLNNDVVIADFEDNYRNLSLKMVLSLKWVKDVCPNAEFVFKCDDDTFVNSYNFLNFIENNKLDPRAFYGRLLKKTVPVRNKNSTWAKWRITEEEYPEALYPDYVSGPGYLFGTEGIDDLLAVALKLPYIYLEDVFITGICASLVNYCIIENEMFVNDQINLKRSRCQILRLFTAHKVYSAKLELMWRIASNFDNYKKCKVKIPKHILN